MSTKHTAPRPAKREGPVEHPITSGMGISTGAEANVYTADTAASRPRASPSIRINS